MFVLARAVTYSTLFIGLLLIFLPGRILASTGIVRPAAIGAWQVAGMLLGASSAALALTCILTFVFIGRGLRHRSIRLVGSWSRVHIDSSGIRCTLVPALPWLVPRSFINRFRFSAMRACSSPSRTCLSWCTRSPHCGELSLEIMRRTIGGSVGGGRNSERYPDSGCRRTAAGAGGGHVCSPGTSLFATGRSSIGQSRRTSWFESTLRSHLCHSLLQAPSLTLGYNRWLT